MAEFVGRWTVARFSVAGMHLAILLALPGLGHAQQPLLHLPLDGGLDNVGKAGGTAQLFTAEGATPPTFVGGHLGKALSFTDQSAVALPFELDHARYPRVTITAWVLQAPGADGSRTILTTGSTSGASLAVNGGRLAMRAGRTGVTFDALLPVGEWVFVAGVFDADGGWARLHQGDGVYSEEGINSSTRPPRKFRAPDDPSSEPRAWLSVGAFTLHNWQRSGRALAIDDVRLYAEALSEEQVEAIRMAGPGYSAASADAGGASCAASAECGAGNYCARDRRCHPDSHRPMEERDAREPVVEAIGETEKNDSAPSAEGIDVARLPGDQYEPRDLPGDQYEPRLIDNTSSPTRTVGVIPEDIVDPEIGAAGVLPVETDGARRTVGQLPDSLGGVDPDRLPTGVPDPQYESPEAAEEAARQRAEAEDEARDQQQALQSKTRIHPRGERLFSGISGHRGEHQDVLELPSEFMRAIHWREKSDHPTYIQLYSYYETPPAQIVEWGEGGGGAGFRSISTPQVISRIEVCSSKNDNKRMKGLRIYGPTVLSDGSLREEPNQDSAQMPNCGQWHPAVICPDGLASGIVVHSDDYGDTYNQKQEIVGLQLVCRAVGVE